jgi:hypothetical protein
MGFDLFVHCFKNKKYALYDRQIAEEIFNRDSIDPATPLTEVRYHDGRAEIYGAEEEKTSGVMLSHFGGRTVLARVLELAEKTGSFIFWTFSEGRAAVANADVLDHLPDEAREVFSEIVVVTTVDELIAAAGLV